MGEKKPVSFGSLVDAMLALEQLRRVSEEGAIMARELGRLPAEQAVDEVNREPCDPGPSSAGQEPHCHDCDDNDQRHRQMRPEPDA